jgi:hypothetical protein
VYRFLIVSCICTYCCVVVLLFITHRYRMSRCYIHIGNVQYYLCSIWRKILWDTRYNYVRRFQMQILIHGFSQLMCEHRRPICKVVISVSDVGPRNRAHSEFRKSIHTVATEFIICNFENSMYIFLYIFLKRNIWNEIIWPGLWMQPAEQGLEKRNRQTWDFKFKKRENLLCRIIYFKNSALHINIPRVVHNG